MQLLNALAASDSNKILIIVSAMHGNEPAGVLAWKRFIKAQRKTKFALNGMVMAYIGNNEAYKKKVRYVDTDMNRLWKSESVWALQEKKNKNTEEKAVLKLLRSMQIAYISRGLDLKQQWELILLDIHTTSVESVPFCVVTSGFKSDFWTRAIGAPVIHGLDKSLGGTSLLSFFTPENFVSPTHGLLLEAGQHTSEQAIDFAYSSIVKTLGVFGMIDDKTAKFFLESAEKLQSAHQAPASEIQPDKQPIPSSLEIIYRHFLQPSDIFEMLPSFKNFDKVTTQTLLAHHNGRPIFAPLDAYLFMPLYQKQGDDGFFLVK